MNNNTPLEPEYSLQVNREELLEGLRSLSTFRKPKAKAKARLFFHAGELIIKMPDIIVRASAQGNWPGEIWAYSWWIWSLAQTPPQSDPVTVSFADGRLKIGTTSADVVREDRTLF